MKAYIAASNYTGMRVELLLETGTHVVTGFAVEKYLQNKTHEKQLDFVNPMFSLTIRPFKCSDNSNSFPAAGEYRCTGDSPG